MSEQARRIPASCSSEPRVARARATLGDVDRPIRMKSDGGGKEVPGESPN